MNLEVLNSPVARRRRPAANGMVCSALALVALALAGFCRADPAPAPAAAAAAGPADVEDRLRFADGLHARGMHELAIREYRSLLADHPSIPQADVIHFRMGEGYRRLEKYAEAEKHYRAVYNKYPKSPWRLKAGFKRADLFMETRQYPAAADLFRIVLKEKPERPLEAACRYFLGEALIKAGKQAEGLQTLEALVNELPSSVHAAYAMLRLADSYDDRPETEAKALAYRQRVAEKPPSRRMAAEALFQLGEAYFRKGDFKRSAAAYGRLLKEYNDDTRADEARLQASWAAHNAGLFAEALREAETMSARPDAPRRDEWLYLKANCERQLVNNDAATRTYDELLKAFPGSTFAGAARYEKAMTLFKAGRPEDAIAEASAVEGDATVKENVYWLLAESHGALGHKREAVQYYRLLLRDFPESRLVPDAMYRLAHHLQAQGQNKEAARFFNLVWQKEPESDLGGRALLASATCLMREERFAEAARDWAALAGRKGPASMIETALYQKALCEIRLERDEDAAASLHELLERFPRAACRADALYWQGVLLSEAGKNTEAVTVLNEALRASPRPELEGDVKFRLGLALQGSGQADEAVRTLTPLLGSAQADRFPPALLGWIAEYHFERQRYEEAERVARKLVERKTDPHWVETGWVLVGRSCLARNLADKAEAAFSIALSDGALTALAPEASLRLAELLEKRGETAAAAQRFARAAALASAETQMGIRAHAYAGMGRTAREGGDWEAAARYFLSVALLYDDADLVPQCLADAAAALRKLGREDEADKALRELRDRFPKHPLAAESGT